MGFIGRLTLIALVMPTYLLADSPTTIKNVRLWAEDERTRVVLDVSSAARHSMFTLQGPDRLVVDVVSGEIAKDLKSLPKGGVVKSIRTGRRPDGRLRVVLDLVGAVRPRSFTVAPSDGYGDRLVIDLHSQGTQRDAIRKAEEYLSGRDIVVAIDAGHGGRDPGAVGRARTKEKDIALLVSKKLAKRISAEYGMQAVLVRSGDYYVDHRDRMEIARKAKADLFISIHADAVEDRRAKGASVYVLSLKGTSDEAARQLAERENGTSVLGGLSLSDKDPVLASVLLDLSQNASLSASLEVAKEVITELARVGKVRRRTVQQAGFLVLKSPDVPSVLVEMAYISNPDEEKLLRSSSHQNNLADAMLKGIRSYFYVNPPADTLIAANRKRGIADPINYVIARGDTLSEIAERYNVSISRIKATNRLSGDTVMIGQTLQIPAYAGT